MLGEAKMNSWSKLLVTLFKHLSRYIFVLIGITFITFSIMRLSPKNPAELLILGDNVNAGIVSEAAISEQEKKMGLDKPFIVQYVSWLVKVSHGDLGRSFITKQPVFEELKKHTLPTLIITFSTISITVALSVPIGILCAINKDGIIDNIMRVFSFFGISISSFVLSLIFLWFFSIKLKLVPIIAKDSIKGYIIPICVLVIQLTSKMTRQVRAIVLEQLSKEYVVGALMRGVKYRTIIYTHVLRNCMVPILTLTSIYIGTLLGGSTIIESVFSINGLGKLAVNSVARLDYYMIQGFVLWSTIVYLVVNLSVDLLATLIDPRIRHDHN